MPTLDEFIHELETYTRLDNIEAGIGELNTKIANYGNQHAPLMLVKRLYLSHRTLNLVTLERRIMRTCDGWLFRENDGSTRVMSDADAADFFKRMLALDRIVVDDNIAGEVEYIARGWFREPSASEGRA